MLGGGGRAAARFRVRNSLNARAGSDSGLMEGRFEALSFLQSTPMPFAERAAGAGGVSRHYLRARAFVLGGPPDGSEQKRQDNKESAETKHKVPLGVPKLGPLVNRFSDKDKNICHQNFSAGGGLFIAASPLIPVIRLS